jgi:inner membrane protein
MDNLTHSLIGLAAAKAGFDKLSPCATPLCILAANLPDADIITGVFGGRWTYLQHHRGITHSIVGTIILALALPLLFYLGDLVIASLRKRGPTIRFRGLLIASLVVTATHPLMDWMNNYGVRPLLPWNARWFYGDFVFILDPFLWLTLGGAAFLLTSKSWKQIIGWTVIVLVPTYLVFFGPIERAGPTNITVLRVLWITVLVVLVVLFKLEVSKRWGVRIPGTALVVAAVYLVSLFSIHAIALAQARAEASKIVADRQEQMIEVAAMPTLANPLNWVCVVETERAAYRFNLSLMQGRSGNLVRYEKPEALNPQALAPALRDHRTQVFLGFARFPVARLAGDCLSQSIVQFADLRYTEPGRDRGTFSLELPVTCDDSVNE